MLGSPADIRIVYFPSKFDVRNIAASPAISVHILVVFLKLRVRGR